MFDKKYNEKGDASIFALDTFEVGSSVGDPLLNCNAPLASKLVVTSPDALLLYLTIPDYKHVFRDLIE